MPGSADKPPITPEQFEGFLGFILNQDSGRINLIVNDEWQSSEEQEMRRPFSHQTPAQKQDQLQRVKQSLAQYGLAFLQRTVRDTLLSQRVIDNLLTAVINIQNKKTEVEK